jgi:hypothetical protein
MYNRSEIEKRLKDLEKTVRCKTRFFDSFEDFPETGAECALYVDESTGDIYIWNGSVFIKNESSGGTDGVPYIGATGDVDLGEYGLKTGNLEFDTTPTDIPTTAGGLYWNDQDGTLDLILKGGNVKLQVGQEEVVRVVNKTGGDLLESQYRVCRIRTKAEGGSQGQRLAVRLAQADTKANHTGILGLVTEDIQNNQEGFITTFGMVNKINTTGALQGESWADGDEIYLSETTPGALTKIEPSNHPVQIGYVVYAHANNGKIFVKVENGVDELKELHDVSITAPVTDGAVLQYDTATSKWKNSASAPLSGTGTSGQVTYWTGSTTQSGSNNLFWDAANNRLGIGINTGLTGTLQIKGSGATSATTALLIQNSTPTNLLQVLDNGRINQTLEGGTANTAFGTGALSLSTGNNNTAIGTSALFSNTTGNGNIAIGVVAMYSNTQGIENVAIGQQALYDNTSGISNTALGFGALRTNSTGNNNVAFGYNSGRYVGSGTSSNQTSGVPNDGNYNLYYGGRISYDYYKIPSTNPSFTATVSGQHIITCNIPAFSSYVQPTGDAYGFISLRLALTTVGHFPQSPTNQIASSNTLLQSEYGIMSSYLFWNGSEYVTYYYANPITRYLPAGKLSIIADLQSGVTYYFTLVGNAYLESKDTTSIIQYPPSGVTSEVDAVIGLPSNVGIDIKAISAGTIVNGGGFQAVLADDKYLRVRDGISGSYNFSTEITGSLMVDRAISKYSLGYGYPPAVKAFCRVLYNGGDVNLATSYTIRNQYNVSTTLTRAANNRYLLTFLNPMDSAEYTVFITPSNSTYATSTVATFGTVTDATTTQFGFRMVKPDEAGDGSQVVAIGARITDTAAQTGEWADVVVIGR